MLFTFNRRVESLTGEVDEDLIAQVLPRMPVVLANESMVLLRARVAIQVRK